MWMLKTWESNWLVSKTLDFMNGEFETLKQASSDSTTQVNELCYRIDTLEQAASMELKMLEAKITTDYGIIISDIHNLRECTFKE